MAITAAMVKELRETTGAGMMDAKKALTETDGDMAAALDWLRTKGLANAAKKSGRTAAEGLVGVAVAGGRGVAVEVNSETDFVGKNAEFQGMVAAIATTALGADNLEALQAAEIDGTPVSTVITNAIAKIGENMTLRRMAGIEGDVVVSYVHNPAADGMGPIPVVDLRARCDVHSAAEVAPIGDREVENRELHGFVVVDRDPYALVLVADHRAQRPEQERGRPAHPLGRLVHLAVDDPAEPEARDVDERALGRVLVVVMVAEPADIDAPLLGAHQLADHRVDVLAAPDRPREVAPGPAREKAEPHVLGDRGPVLLEEPVHRLAERSVSTHDRDSPKLTIAEDLPDDPRRIARRLGQPDLEARARPEERAFQRGQAVLRGSGTCPRVHDQGEGLLHGRRT